MSRKKEIYKALLNIIEREGLTTNISISSIANEAGIGKSTIYEYFKNKDELFIEALLYRMDEGLNNLTILNFEQINFEQSLKLLIKTIAEGILNNSNFKDMFAMKNIGNIDLNTAMLFKAKVEESKEILDKVVTEIIKKGCEEQIINMPTEFEVYCVLNMVLSVAHGKIAIDENTDIEELIIGLYNIILKIFK